VFSSGSGGESSLIANIDEGILRELGARLGATRLERNLTQAALAEQAGGSKRTFERLEAGEVATRLSGFLRVCRALGLVERFETLVSESMAGPMAKLKLQGRKRQRASGRKGADHRGRLDGGWARPCR
jgi:transcriptional regulator with XRE-family HTH domain